MRKAFTLIEMLVVLAIIGLLAGLIFPVLARVREKGRQASCLSHLRQMGVAMLLYAHDYDETLPSGQFRYKGALPEGNLSGVGWAGQLYPYVQNKAVFACPDEIPVSAFRLEVTPHLKISPAGVPVSYAYNSYLLDEVPGVRGRLTELKTSDDDVLLFEINGNVVDVTRPDEGRAQGVNLFSASGNGNQHVVAGDGGGRGPLIQPDVVYATGLLQGIEPADLNQRYLAREGRHSGGANYLLADGHAGWLTPQSVCPANIGGRCDPKTRAFFNPRRDEWTTGKPLP